VLVERLEVKVPANRAVKVKGPESTKTISTEAGFRVYTWVHSRLEDTKEPADDEKKQIDTALGRLPSPEIQISSFRSWEEVGLWYWNLQKDQVAPTPAIRSKAAELTEGLADDTAKLRALYAFVSTQYRYIGIAFGLGRYQPHAADDVLTNNYGDCKDKHTLLASLAQATGITLYPALISSSWRLDPDIPSPAQFDHVIGYLPQGKNAIWLDTTPEVAPFGLLIQQLRDKQALVMSGDKSIQMVTTPADPPSPGTEHFKIEGKLSEDGTLVAKIEISAQGENEAILRSAFRTVPQPQWKDLVQQLSYSLNFAGTVSDVNASPPETLSEPFHFSYSYNRKDYPDWSDRRLTVPGLPFGIPPLKDDAKYPVWLGSPSEIVSDTKVELPSGYLTLPVSDVDLKYDFAEYHASYSHEGSVIVCKRRLLTKMHEVPVAEFGDYKNFVKSLQNDVNQYVQTASTGPTLPGMPNSTVLGAIPPTLRALWNLPPSSSEEANRLEAEARDEMKKRDSQGAVSSLYRAVSVDPKFTRAWVLLGQLLLMQKQVDAGVDAFHKAMAADPEQRAIPKSLGAGLMNVSQFEQAVSVWQDYMKAHPNDSDGPTNLGNCLLRLKRYSEAAAAFEAAAKIREDRGNLSTDVDPAYLRAGERRLQAQLGSAYLLAGERDKAGAAFGKLADMDPDENTFNEVAYRMAKADLQLPLALDYATRAVRLAEEKSQKITLPDLKAEDLTTVLNMANEWDTFGWIYVKMSKLDAAEAYLRASWMLTEDGVIAGHLCDLYRRTHQDAKAIDMCKAAIYRMSQSHLSPEEYATETAAAQENLEHVTSSKTKATATIDASDLINHERTFKLPRLVPGTESAEFFVLLANDAKGKPFKVEDVKFISGSHKIKPFGERLKIIDFNVPTPGEASARFVRRGILGCYEYSGCSFVLLDPATVHSVN
jgi:tetratricopeptide (TPR) repeat protein